MYFRARCALAISAALLGAVAGCGSDEPEGSNGPKTRNAPPGPADLCETIGTEMLRRFIPSPEPRAEKTDFGLFNESSCSVSSSSHTVSPDRANLWVEFKRHGTDASGRTADEICRRDLEGHRTSSPSASPVPLSLGDVTEAQVLQVQEDFEATILLCRSADFLEVRYRSSGVDAAGASTAAQEIARRVLAELKR
jgi:hypothetical protein